MSATSAPARAARAYTKAAQTPSLGAIYDNRPAAIAMPNWGMDALRDCLEHDCKHVRALQAELREAFERIRRTASALCPPQKRGQGADFDRSDWRS